MNHDRSMAAMATTATHERTAPIYDTVDYYAARLAECRDLHEQYITVAEAARTAVEEGDLERARRVYVAFDRARDAILGRTER